MKAIHVHHTLSLQHLSVHGLNVHDPNVRDPSVHGLNLYCRHDHGPLPVNYHACLYRNRHDHDLFPIISIRFITCKFGLLDSESAPLTQPSDSPPTYINKSQAEIFAISSAVG